MAKGRGMGWPCKAGVLVISVTCRESWLCSGRWHFFFFFNLVGKPDFLVKELEEESWYSWCLCLGDPR